ncbi:MAG: hypothetical protein NVS4B3_25970 [Gemmatimonadaceae bacterium]
MPLRPLLRGAAVFGALVVASTVAVAQHPAAANGHVVRVNGKAVYYEETGAGEPLILLHRFGGSTGEWRDYLPPLSAKHRVIAVDLAGHGRSDPVDTGAYFFHAHAARQVLGLMDSVHLATARVMGASSGGMVARYMATQAQARVVAAVTIGSQLYISTATRTVIESRGPDSTDSQAMRTYEAEHGPAGARRLARQFWNERIAYGDPMFTPDLLATISARWLVVQGYDDRIVPASQAWEMAHAITGARLWVVPRGGPLPHLNGRVSDYAPIFLDFLDGTMKPMP